MKLKELLPLLRNEPFWLVFGGNWENHIEVSGYADFEEFSEEELEMEVTGIDPCTVFLEGKHEA